MMFLPLTYMRMHTDTAMLLGGGNTSTGYEGAKFTSSPWLPLPHLHLPKSLIYLVIALHK